MTVTGDEAAGEVPADRGRGGPAAGASAVEGTPRAQEQADRDFQTAWQLFQSVENQVQIVDIKVQAIFAANTLLVAAISFENQGSLPHPNPHGFSLASGAGLAAHLLLLACVCLSSLSAMVALFPRIRVAASRPRSLLFFGDIAALPDARFVEDFLGLATADKVKHLLRQTHAVSGVVVEKYKWTRRAGVSLVLALLLWIALQLVKTLSGA